MTAPKSDLLFQKAVFLEHCRAKWWFQEPCGRRTTGQQDQYAHHDQASATALWGFDAGEWLLIQATEGRHGTGAKRSSGILAQAVLRWIREIEGQGFFFFKRARGTVF